MISFNTDNPKIGVFRALNLGDLMCAIPAFRALRKAYPNAEIVLIGLPWAANFVERFRKYIDRLVVFPGYHGLPEQEFHEKSWQVFVELMRDENFDIIIQMHGNGTIVNEVLQLLDPSQLAGYETEESAMNSPLFISYPNEGNEILRHLSLLEHLGIATDGFELEFPISEDEKTAIKKLAPFIEVKHYVCIHPGSRAGWRQWPPAHFATLADQCVEEGYKVVFTGTQDEKPIIAEVRKWMKHYAMDLSGKTSLGMIAYLIEQSALLIANCTGVSHIAAAVGTPSLIISMDGEPERWGPLNHNLHKVFDWSKSHSLPKVYDEFNNLLDEIRMRQAVS